jgi:hypothetical protein
MKYKDMNGQQKIAYRNIKGVFNWEIGGWYNCIQDNCIEDIPDTIEDAKDIIYEESLVHTAREGYFGCGKAPREMRFAGSEFIHGVIDELFATDDDALEIADVKGWNV